MIANPAAGYLLLLIPLVILLHLIRRRRKRVVVSSLMIWDRVVKSSRRVFLTSRLLRNLLLLLQVCAILLLVFSLSGVSVPLPSAGYDENLVLVLDVTASMRAESEGTVRFEEARGLAERIIRDLAPGRGAMIMTAGRKAGPAVSYTRDKGVLLDGLKDLEAGDEAGDVNTALRTALSVAEGRRIILITGPETEVDPDLAAVGTLEVRRVGKPGNNLAITAFSSRRPLHGRYSLDVYLEVTNYGSEAVEAPVTVEFDGETEKRFDGTFYPGRGTPFIFSHDGLLPEKLYARLDYDDMLQSDNEAFLSVREHSHIRVLLVTPGNPYLETLLTLVPGLEMYVTPRAETETGGADVVIYDRLAPAFVDSGRYLFINTLPPGYGFRYAGELGGEGLSVREPGHPLVRDGVISGITITEGAAYTGPDTPLVVRGFLPVLSVYERPGIRWIRLSPDLYDTDLPYRPAFPILIGRCLQWLSTGGVESPGAVGAGEPLPGGLPYTEVTVLTPSGNILQTTTDGEGRVHTDTSKAGFYTLYVGGREKTVGVNPAGDGESNLLMEAKEGAGGGTGFSAGDTHRTLRLDPILLVAALVILAGECYLAFREERD